MLVVLVLVLMPLIVRTYMLMPLLLVLRVFGSLRFLMLSLVRVVLLFILVGLVLMLRRGSLRG